MSGATVTIEVNSSFGVRRRAIVLDTPVEKWLAFRRIAFAMVNAEETDRPGFREVIDNLHWDEMR
jgi:hypothetical protein